MSFVDEYYHYATPIGPDGTPYEYYEAFRDCGLRHAGRTTPHAGGVRRTRALEVPQARIRSILA